MRYNHSLSFLHTALLINHNNHSHNQTHTQPNRTNADFLFGIQVTFWILCTVLCLAICFRPKK